MAGGQSQCRRRNRPGWIAPSDRRTTFFGPLQCHLIDDTKARCLEEDCDSRRDLENARWLKEEVERTPQWHVLAPVPLQTVCVRHEPPTLLDDPHGGDALDRHTLRWAKAVNDSGGAFLTPSLLDGRWMVRVSLGAETQTREDVAATWALMQECADAAVSTISSAPGRWGEAIFQASMDTCFNRRWRGTRREGRGTFRRDTNARTVST